MMVASPDDVIAPPETDDEIDAMSIGATSVADRRVAAAVAVSSLAIQSSLSDVTGLTT